MVSSSILVTPTLVCGRFSVLRGDQADAASGLAKPAVVRIAISPTTWTVHPP
jgi:hypothetical protein